MNNCQEYEFVDLGLPSGTLWATCNVGARKPDGIGEYIALDDCGATTKNREGGWHVPSKEQWEELMQNTKSEWVKIRGVNGRLFVARNGSNLFLPAAGFYWDFKPLLVGEIGNYWSSSLFTDNPTGAWSFGFSSNDEDIGLGYDGKGDGLSVRLVCDAE